MKELSQGHRAGRWQSRCLNPDNVASCCPSSILIVYLSWVTTGCWPGPMNVHMQEQDYGSGQCTGMILIRTWNEYNKYNSYRAHSNMDILNDIIITILNVLEMTKMLWLYKEIFSFLRRQMLSYLGWRCATLNVLGRIKRTRTNIAKC